MTGIAGAIAVTAIGSRIAGFACRSGLLGIVNAGAFALAVAVADDGVCEAATGAVGGKAVAVDVWIDVATVGAGVTGVAGCNGAEAVVVVDGSGCSPFWRVGAEDDWSSERSPSVNHAMTAAVVSTRAAAVASARFLPRGDNHARFSVMPTRGVAGPVAGALPAVLFGLRPFLNTSVAPLTSSG